jgi:hypothetical protein
LFPKKVKTRIKVIKDTVQNLHNLGGSQLRLDQTENKDRLILGSRPAEGFIIKST